MKLKIVAFLFLVALLLTYLFLDKKSNVDKDSTIKTASAHSTEAAQTISEPALVTAAQPSGDAVPSATETNNDPDAFLKAKGFVEDPENPDQLVKKTVGPNGQPLTFYVQKIVQSSPIM